MDVFTKVKQKQDLTNVVSCKQCELLGHIASKKWSIGGPIASLFFTVSPDPQWDIGCISYNEKNPEAQMIHCRHIIEMTVKELMSMNYTVYAYSIHFEFNKSGNVHSHGLIITNDRYCPYKVLPMTCSKIVHRICGRQYVKSLVAGWFEWVKSVDVYKYVNKDNDFPPVHIVGGVPMTITEMFDKSGA